MPMNSYQIAVMLSFLSVLLGLGREFLIVALLGFSATNDQLQIYLSIFYSLSLSIDAIRLAGLNLFNKASFLFIACCAAVICIPFTIAVGLFMSYLAGGLDFKLLGIAVLGGLLNLMTALVITYKQRFGAFLPVQIINVLPNFVLLPGIIFVYFLAKTNAIPLIVGFCTLVPIVQLFLLLWIPITKPKVNNDSGEKISFSQGVLVFFRHSITMLGEQVFQLITRALFFKLGAGYLSVLAISVRVYTAARFIFIDSYIGSKLSNWSEQVKQKKFSVDGLLEKNILSVVLLIASCWVIYNRYHSLFYFSIQIVSLLFFSFYFSTLVRIIYFKINRFEHNSNLIIKFGIYELFFVGIGSLLTAGANLPLMIFLWLWYVAKPFMQLLLLRPRFYKLKLA